VDDNAMTFAYLAGHFPDSGELLKDQDEAHHHRETVGGQEGDGGHKHEEHDRCHKASQSRYASL
jgi:hypothetical protein